MLMLILSESVFDLSKICNWQQDYNIVNTIMPIGIFLLGFIYFLFKVKDAIAEDCFNLISSKNLTRASIKLTTALLVVYSFLGIMVGYSLGKLNDENSKGIFYISILWLIIILVLFFFQAFKINKEEKIINYLNGKKKMGWINKCNTLIFIFSSVVLGCAINNIENFVKQKNILKGLELGFVSIGILIVQIFLYDFLSFIADVVSTQKVIIINKEPRFTVKGKIFKIDGYFIVIIKENGKVSYINKNEVSRIELVESKDKNNTKLKRKRVRVNRINNRKVIIANQNLEEKIMKKRNNKEI